MRPRHLFLICLIAAWLGILLASADRGARATPKQDPDAVSDTGPPAEGAAPVAEPNREDPGPAAPMREQPKREQPVSPRVEPQPDPPPDLSTPARQAAYVQIVAAFEGVEASAVKRFGRRPQPDDKAAFTIPFKAFVDGQTRRARKQLASDLGLSESAIDQIKAEGDQSGWPKK
jgi:hypothetical protein